MRSCHVSKIEINIDTSETKGPILSNHVHSFLQPILTNILGDYPAELFLKQPTSSLKITISLTAPTQTTIEIQGKFKSSFFNNIPFMQDAPATKVEVSAFSVSFISDYETKKLKLMYINLLNSRIHGNQAKPFINLYLTRTSTEVVLARPLKIISSPEEACKDMEALGVNPGIRMFAEMYSSSKSPNSVSAIEEFSQFRLYHKFANNSQKGNSMAQLIMAGEEESNALDKKEEAETIVEVEILFDKQYYLVVDRKNYTLEKGIMDSTGQVSLTCISDLGSKILIDVKEFSAQSYNVPAIYMHKGNIFKCMEPFKWMPGGVYVSDPFAFRMPFVEAEKSCYLRLNTGSVMHKAAANNRNSMVIKQKNMSIVHKPMKGNNYEATLTLAKPYSMKNFVPHLINLTALKGRVKVTANSNNRKCQLNYDALEMEMELFTSPNSSITLKTNGQDRYFFVEHNFKLSFFCKCLNLQINMKGLKNNKSMKKMLVNYEDWIINQTCIYVIDAVQGIRLVSKGSTMNKDEDEFELDYSRKYVHLVVRQRGGLKSDIIGLVPLKSLASELAKVEAKCKTNLYSACKNKILCDVIIRTE